MTLKELAIGDAAVVTEVGGSGALRQHFFDMGLVPGVKVQMVKYAPMGDPIEIRIHTYELSLRKEDADQIQIRPVTEDDTLTEAATKEADPLDDLTNEHPGFGEEGKYHDKKTENPLPEGTTLTFALAGNQNSGKTTLFNALTGSNQHVGNFPGVTVDRKDGVIKKHPETKITDLPGIYSLSPYTNEEIVTRQFILGEKPKGIINIIDCTNIERNLYLTMQLLELGVPMVIALNFMNEVIDNGGSVRINELEKQLGVPVVAINPITGEGIDELVKHAIHVAKYQEAPKRQDFCDENDHGGAVHRCLHAIMHLIEDHAKAAEIPARFAAAKLIEGDDRVENALNLDQNEKETLEHIILQLEQERGLDRSAAIADMRYEFINKITEQTIVKPKESKQHKRSEKIDKVLTGRYTAVPIFILVMAAIFYLTFNLIGAWLQDLLDMFISWLAGLTESAMVAGNVNDVLTSFVIDGIFGGVGSVLSFLPIVILMFFFLSLLEDSGYMARIAFVMDRPLRKIGLSGRSIVPMLMGFGCSVPAIMSARTLPSERDRKMTILLTPYMSCSAKIPIYAYFSVIFFPGKSWLVMFLLYFTGIAIGILNAAIARRTAFKGEAAPFVMELPNYRMPGAKTTGRLMWEKSKEFVQRAFTIILLGTLIIWFLQTLDTHFHMVEDPSNSILAVFCNWISPVFKPTGLGDWRIISSIVSGILAKETVVATLTMLFGSTAAVAASISGLQAISLLVFCLLYTPCMAAIAAVRRELGHKYAILVFFEQLLVAWFWSMVVFQIGSLIV